jgi:CheY-like chemotaxis protein
VPGISGFELFAQMQSLPGHRHTPALFVTAFENFSARCQPEVLGDNDLLAKPYLPIELIVKAVMAVKRQRFA